MIDIIYDMETGDPDDCLTLTVLGSHPKVNLIGVNITPGTPYQVGIVRYILKRFDLDIPVGVYDLDHKKDQDITCVSRWHYNMFGDIPPSSDCVKGWELVFGLYRPNTTLVTGAPLKNLGSYLNKIFSDVSLGRLYVQGGYAGDGVVHIDLQLEKFRGMSVCPTYNFNGDPISALSVISSDRFVEKKFISKNVCHGVIYDRDLHEKLKSCRNPYPGLSLVIDLMGRYLDRRPTGKKFHDPLAAMCAINPDIGVWKKVEIYKDRGSWGSRLCPGSDCEIIIDYDRELFIDTLCGYM